MFWSKSTGPRFSSDAESFWARVPKESQEVILNNVWCSTCGHGVSMELEKGTMEGDCLVLHGRCAECNGKVARLVEPPE